MTKRSPFKIEDAPIMAKDIEAPAMELRESADVVYDPTQEIVDRLDRIAKALEEHNALMRDELRTKGIIP